MQPHRRCTALLAILFALVASLTAGCTTSASKPRNAPPTSQPANAQVDPPSTATTNSSATTIPVTRYGRYTLVELVAEPAQRNLMQQIVDITIPPTLDATVGDAMRHALLRSGYRLCASAQATVLFQLPLPAADLHLGPLTLREALLTLAGPAWDLSVDDAFRCVCFEPHQPAPTLEVQP